MYTAEELKEKFKKESEYQKAIDKANKKLKESCDTAIRENNNRVVVPLLSLSGLYSFDEQQSAFADYLNKKGYDVRKIREMSSGVLQDPNWFLYF